MLNVSCRQCELIESCEKVGISLDEMQKLLFLVGQDTNDPFALGMIKFTLKNRNGNFNYFQDVLFQNSKIRHCLLK